MVASCYPQAYVKFLAHFHGDRDYFECHEILESFWKEQPESPNRDIWAAFIQAAVGMYHYRRGNLAGAAKSLKGALRRSQEGPLRELGVDGELWLQRLRETVDKIQAGGPFRDLEIPIADDRLLSESVNMCKDMGFDWGTPSALENHDLVDRHTRRDRTQVIEARQRSLAERAERRKQLLEKREN